MIAAELIDQFVVVDLLAGVVGDHVGIYYDFILCGIALLVNKLYFWLFMGCWLGVVLGVLGLLWVFHCWLFASGV